jgi:hypothetical protein
MTDGHDGPVGLVLLQGVEQGLAGAEGAGPEWVLGSGGFDGSFVGVGAGFRVLGGKVLWFVRVPGPLLAPRLRVEAEVLAAFVDRPGPALQVVGEPLLLDVLVVDLLAPEFEDEVGAENRADQVLVEPAGDLVQERVEREQVELPERAVEGGVRESMA